MSTDPEILSSPFVPSGLPPAPVEEPAPRRIPNLGHTVLFFAVAMVRAFIRGRQSFDYLKQNSTTPAT